MRRLSTVTESAGKRGEALAQLRESSNMPEGVDFSSSFVEPPAAGRPERAVAASRAMTQTLARNLKADAQASLLAPPPRPMAAPGILPSDPADLVKSMPVSDLPYEMLTTEHEAEDQGGEKHSFTLAQTLEENNISEVAAPHPTPEPSHVLQAVRSADPGAFGGPSSGGGSGGSGGGAFGGANPPPPLGVGNASGGGFAGDSRAATTVLGAGMDAGFGTQDALGIGGELSNLLPPEAAAAVQQGIGLGRSFGDMAKNGLNAANAAGAIGQIGDALGVPGLGQAAQVVQQLASMPGGLEAALSDPSALFQVGLGQLMGQLPPMAQAAIGQAQAIAGALKDLTAPAPGAAAGGAPGVYVENLLIARTIGSQTVHGIPLMPGPGSIPTVFAMMMPVWRVAMDIHFCPLPSTPVTPHGPGVVPMGAMKTFAQGGLIARHTDQVIEALGGPAAIIPMPTAQDGGDDDSDDSDEPDEPADSSGGDGGGEGSGGGEGQSENDDGGAGVGNEPKDASSGEPNDGANGSAQQGDYEQDARKGTGVAPASASGPVSEKYSKGINLQGNSQAEVDKLRDTMDYMQDKSPSFKGTVDQIDNSGNTVTVKYVAGAAGTQADNAADSCAAGQTCVYNSGGSVVGTGNGTNSTVSIDPTQAYPGTHYNATGGDVLAHEMGHAAQNATGTVPGGTTTETVTDKAGNTVTYTVPTQERYTVDHYENKYRADRGRPLRPTYSP